MNFAVTGTGLPQRAATVELESLGDSVLVVGDESTLKVHVHTDDPDAATGVFAEAGSVSHLDVADMHEQVAVRAARLETVETYCTVVAVVSNAEMANLFEQTIGVDALEGGPTLNPSTYELLASIHSAHSEEVVVLPNSSNVVMAAQKAAELSEKRVTVLPTRSQQAGLVAITYFEPGRDAAENVEIMERELAAVRTGGVAPAARDDGQGRFQRRRRRRLRRRGARGLGGSGGDAARGVRAPRRRRRDPHRDPRATARRSTTPRWPSSRPTASRSRPSRAASHRGGGCCPPSDADS